MTQDSLYDLEGVFLRNYDRGPFSTIVLAVEDSSGRLGMRTFVFKGERVSRGIDGRLEPSERGSRVFRQEGPTKWP